MERMNDAPSDVLDLAGESCRSEFLQDSTSCEAETRSDQPLSLTRLSAYWPVLEWTLTLERNRVCPGVYIMSCVKH